jgi:hypothetical protein
MAIPSLLSMAVDGNSLALYFSEPLKTILPSRNRFLVMVNGVRYYASANASLSDGDTIRLTLTNSIPAGASVSVTYTSVNGFDLAGFGDIRSASTNQAAAFFRTTTTANLTGTAPASLTISSNSPSLLVGESATITFTFSRNPGSSFTSSDITLLGGTLSALSGSGLSRTATFTPTPGSSGIASITVAAGSYTDLFGNSGSAGTTPALSYDTLAPTLAITSSSAALIAGQTATITFTFSEAPSGFTAGDISISGGSISGLAVTADPTIYTATFTPTAASSGAASITVAAGTYTDAAGNSGGAGTTPALTYDTRLAVDLSAISGGDGGFVINGQSAGDLSGSYLASQSGFSVASAGDVNGDGLADLIVGARYSNSSAGVKGGRSYVVFGKSTSTAIDLATIAAGSGSSGFVIDGDATFTYSGWSVASAGDVNGDGLADLLVGAIKAENDQSTRNNAGRSYVVFGKKPPPPSISPPSPPTAAAL